MTFEEYVQDLKAVTRRMRIMVAELQRLNEVAPLLSEDERTQSWIAIVAKKNQVQQQLAQLKIIGIAQGHVVEEDFGGLHFE